MVRKRSRMESVVPLAAVTTPLPARARRVALVEMSAGLSIIAIGFRLFLSAVLRLITGAGSDQA